MKKTVLLVLAVMIAAVMFVGCSSTQYSFSRHVATIPLVEDEVASNEDDDAVPEEIAQPIRLNLDGRTIPLYKNCNLIS